MAIDRSAEKGNSLSITLGRSVGRQSQQRGREHTTDSAGQKVTSSHHLSVLQSSVRFRTSIAWINAETDGASHQIPAVMIAKNSGKIAADADCGWSDELKKDELTRDLKSPSLRL